MSSNKSKGPKNKSTPGALPSTAPPSGFRDFGPAEAAERARVFATIRDVYSRFGFDPLETPALERLEVLQGKYGEEAEDKLLFKVLRRGADLQEALKNAPQEADLTELGLRYDLTLPLARFFASHRSELPHVFKRYQIAPVWRADRPARGRFREFYQCDVDVVGSPSVMAEADLLAAGATALAELGFGGAEIRLSHRGILAAVMRSVGVREPGLAVGILDKLDKIGPAGVLTELVTEAGLTPDQADRLIDLLGSPAEPAPEGGWLNGAVLNRLRAAIGEDPEGIQGLKDLDDLLLFSTWSPANLRIDPALARGLDYYTGLIYEVRVPDFAGSVGGGGRYDGLIGVFGKSSVPACGFSLGVERLLMLRAERKLAPATPAGPEVMVTQHGYDLASEVLGTALSLRASGFRTELYSDPGHKLKRQLAYADERGVRVVILEGERERAAGVVSVRDMAAQTQIEVPADHDAIAEAVRAILSRT